MKTGVVDQMTTAIRTIATPRRDCMGEGGEEGPWDEVPGSKDAGICFPFSTRSVPLPRVKSVGIQCMTEHTSVDELGIDLPQDLLLSYAIISLAVPRLVPH